MKTDLTTYGPHLQSQKRLAGAVEGKKGQKLAGAHLDPTRASKESSAPDYKVELSKPASLPSPITALPDLPVLRPEIKKPEKAPEIKKPEIKEGTLNRPVVIFVKGMDVFSSPSNSEGGYAGVGRMAEAIEGSRIYGWDQGKEIIQEIKKVKKDQAVILVGHSFGGDTALEVADELDSLEHNFRKVDLLITIDAVGFENDIIPQNVVNHLNVFGESDSFLNDGPHVARRNEKTQVNNILSPLDHTELDDAKDLQFEIVNLIQETLTKRTS